MGRGGDGGGQIRLAWRQNPELREEGTFWVPAFLPVRSPLEARDSSVFPVSPDPRQVTLQKLKVKKAWLQSMMVAPMMLWGHLDTASPAPCPSRNQGPRSGSAQDLGQIIALRFLLAHCTQRHFKPQGLMD